MRFRRLVPPPTPYPSNHAHACAPHPLGSRPTSLTRYPCSHLTRGLALTPRSTTHGRVPLTRPAFLRLTPHAFTRDTHHAFTRSLPHAAHAYVTVKSPRVCDPTLLAHALTRHSFPHTGSSHTRSSHVAGASTLELVRERPRRRRSRGNGSLAHA